MVKRYEPYEAYAACVTDIKIEGRSSGYDCGRSSTEERKTERDQLHRCSVAEKFLLYASGSYI